LIKALYLGTLILLFVTASYAQQSLKPVEGKVTYFSSQNVYAEFASTEGLTEGDTVFIAENHSPYMIIRFISSRSVAGKYIGTDKPVKGTALYANAKISLPAEQKQAAASVLSDSSAQEQNRSSISARSINVPVLNNIDGKFSVQTSSDYNSGNLSSQNLQRWRYTFSLAMDNIAESGLDFQTYSNYSYTSTTFISSSDPFMENLRVYSLNFKYTYEKNTTLRLGRFQSSQLASLGPVDGVVAEHNFTFASIGGIFGSHPDFSNYGYNFNFMQFGIFASRNDTLGEANTEQSIGLFQQMNKSAVDRRFLYYQNTANLFRTLNVFFSTEFDFYKKEAGVISSTPQLTGLFTSVRYSPFSVFSVGVSYDARRNVIYYETYKSFLDSVIINELRQGIRLNVVIRPVKGLTVGLNNSYRNQKGDSKPNNNFGGYVFYSQIPYLEISPVLNYTRLSNSFTDGYSAGITLSRNLLNLFDLAAGYRLLHYKFLQSGSVLDQQTYTADIYYSFSRSLSLGINFESSHDPGLTQNRLFIDLTARF